MEKVFGILKVLFEALIKFMSEHKGITLLITVFTIVTGVTTNLQENERRKEIHRMWIEQQPATHWAKDNEFDTNIGNWLSDSKSLLNALWNIEVQGWGQKGTAGEAAEAVFNKLDSGFLKKYKLIYVDSGKKVRTIKLEVGESIDIKLLHGDTEVLLDFTGQQYLDATSGMTDTKIAFSCIEDPSIAKILNGKITGLCKGTTKLLMCNNRYIWEYEVKIK